MAKREKKSEFGVKKISSIKIDVMLKEDSEGGYTAECIELNVVTEGDTMKEVMKNIKDAIALHIETACKEGIAEEVLAKIYQKTKKPELREIHVPLQGVCIPNLALPKLC